MAQKIHPKGFRLGITQQFSSKWFTKDLSKYQNFVQEDALIRQFFAQRFSNLREIIIERDLGTSSKFSKTPSSCLITLIVETRANSVVSPLSKNVLTFRNSKKFRRNQIISDINVSEAILNQLIESIKIHNATSMESYAIQIKKVASTNENAESVGLKLHELCLEAQKKDRFVFKPILKQLQRDLSKTSSLRGFRVELAGPTASSPMASREIIFAGTLPRQTILADIDYCGFAFQSKIGTIGAKIWLHR